MKSSTEGEVVGVSDFMPNMIWTRMFLREQGFALEKNTLYQDNQSSMKLENNGRISSTKNTRHMEIRYFFITDNIKRGKLSVKYCPTESMLGDYYTKPQQGSRMHRSRVSILNLSKDPTLVSQECVGTCAPTTMSKLANTNNISDDRCVCNHVPNNNDPSEPDVLVRRKAASYLMAAKGLLQEVKNKVDRLDHFIQLT